MIDTDMEEINLSDNLRFELMREKLIEELKAWRPDLIHLHTEGGIALLTDQIKKAVGAPVIMTAHTNYTYYFFGKKWNTLPARTIARGIGGLLYRRADCLIAPSEKVRSFPYIRPLSDRVRVIPNGIDVSYWRQPVAPEEKAALFRSVGFEDNGHTLITVSRLGKEKNIQEILQNLPPIIEEQPDTQLLIVGDGPYRKKLEALCEGAGLTEHVHFTGMVPSGQVRSYLAMGNVFVSASSFEVHSIAYLEAMSCGLPLVVKEDDSVKGVVENGKNGFIFRSGGEFCSAVSKILSDGSLCEDMGENALLTVDGFREEVFVERTLALYYEVLEVMKGEGQHE